MTQEQHRSDRGATEADKTDNQQDKDKDKDTKRTKEQDKDSTPLCNDSYILIITSFPPISHSPEYKFHRDSYVFVSVDPPVSPITYYR